MPIGTERPDVVDTRDFFPPELTEDSKMKQLPAVAQVARDFGNRLLWFIAAVTLTIMVFWFKNMPGLPEPCSNQATVESYKILADSVTQHAVGIFDAIIIKGLLPLFAAVVGFFLGQQTTGPINRD